MILKTIKRAEMTWGLEENSEFVVSELVVESDEHGNYYEKYQRKNSGS